MPSTDRFARRAVLRAGAVLAAAGLAGCSTVLGREETEESSSTHDVPAGASLAVENRNGAVTVERGDGDSLALTAVTRTRAGRDHLDRVEVRARSDGDRFVVESVPVDGTDVSRVSVDLTLGVPESVPVASVRTENGAVRLSDTTGDTDVRTGNGAITVEGADGVLSLVTSNGAIGAGGVRAFRELRTANGAIDATVPGMAGDLTVETGNGRVALALDRGLDARLDAASENGAVSVEGLDLAGGRVTGNRATGRLGEGTHELVIRTGDGAVDLTAMEEVPTGDGS